MLKRAGWYPAETRASGSMETNMIPESSAKCFYPLEGEARALETFLAAAGAGGAYVPTTAWHLYDCNRGGAEMCRKAIRAAVELYCEFAAEDAMPPAQIEELDNGALEFESCRGAIVRLQREDDGQWSVEVWRPESDDLPVYRCAASPSLWKFDGAFAGRHALEYEMRTVCDRSVDRVELSADGKVLELWSGGGVLLRGRHWDDGRPASISVSTELRSEVHCSANDFATIRRALGERGAPMRPWAATTA